MTENVVDIVGSNVVELAEGILTDARGLSEPATARNRINRLTIRRRLDLGGSGVVSCQRERL